MVYGVGDSPHRQDPCVLSSFSNKAGQGWSYVSHDHLSGGMIWSKISDHLMILRTFARDVDPIVDTTRFVMESPSNGGVHPSGEKAREEKASGPHLRELACIKTNPKSKFACRFKC